MRKPKLTLEQKRKILKRAKIRKRRQRKKG